MMKRKMWKICVRHRMIIKSLAYRKEYNKADALKYIHLFRMVY